MESPVPSPHTHMTLDALQKASALLTGAYPLGEILHDMAAYALQVVGIEDPPPSCFSHILLEEDDFLVFKAASPARMLPVLLGKYRRIDLNGRSGGIAGDALKSGKTRYIKDVHPNKHYLPLDDGVHAQVSIPLMVRDTALGVLSIEHPSTDPFTPEDVRHLETLARLTASAIDNHTQRQQIAAVSQVREREALRGQVSAAIQKMERAREEAKRARTLRGIALSVIGAFSDFTTESNPEEPLESFWASFHRILPELCHEVGAEVGIVLKQIRDLDRYQVETQHPPRYSPEKAIYTLPSPEWDRIRNQGGGVYYTTIDAYSQAFSGHLPMLDWVFLDPVETEIAVLLVDGHEGASRLILILANQREPLELLETETSDNRLWFEQQSDIFNLIALRLREIYGATVQAETHLKYERDRQQFVQDMMHQLVGPLSGLKADTEVLLMDILSPEDQKDTLKRLAEQASLFQGYAVSFSLAAQSTSILNISERTFVNVDSERLLALLEKHTRSFMGQARFELIDGPHVLVDSFAHFPPLSINEDFFGILLLNMYDNAMKYSKRGVNAPIHIHGSVDGRAVEIHVTNHGVPIYTSDIQTIFQRYARTEDAESFAPIGTGIGLYLCDKIIKIHGGSISVHPSKLSSIVTDAHEVTFTIRLPVAVRQP